MLILSQQGEPVSTDLLQLLEIEWEAATTELLPSQNSQSSWFMSDFSKALSRGYTPTYEVT